MNSPLAIASISCILKDILNDGLINQNISGISGNFTVTALPPDLIDVKMQGQSQINLYMYRATFNQGLKNVALPRRENQGERLSNPPLALDLHYFLTSYGSNELQTEILLGYSMQLLHERPVLDRTTIQRSLTSPKENPAGKHPSQYMALSTSELTEQLEQIKIIPENLGIDELSKLWTAFGAKYRPSVAYKVSVILIESIESII